MTYTLDMAADLEPRIAEDGVQDVPLTRARALLTRLIEQAREDGLVSAFTVRGRRRAFLVTPGFYERAAEDRLTALALARYVDGLDDEERGRELQRDIALLRTQCSAAGP